MLNVSTCFEASLGYGKHASYIQSTRSCSVRKTRGASVLSAVTSTLSRQGATWAFLNGLVAVPASGKVIY